MKTILFLLAFFHQPIEWNAEYKLKWSDYQGYYDNSEVSASTCSEIIMTMSKDSSGGVIFDVKALFHPESSFISPTCSRSRYALEHEQLHFDITELYARELRTRLKPFQSTHNQDDVGIANWLYEFVVEEWNIEEDYYDAQTMHSQNKDAQFKWEADVHLRLKSSETNVNQSSPRLRTIRRQPRAY